MMILYIYLAIVNVAAFVLYGVDKQKAIRHKWRIPEHTLLGAAAVGGGLGAFLGMCVFHHKTQHTKFVLGVPFFLLLWIGIIILAVKHFGW